MFQFSWLVGFMSLLLCGSVALVLGFTVDPKLAIAVSLSLLALLYVCFGETVTLSSIFYGLVVVESVIIGTSLPPLTMKCKMVKQS